MLRKISKREKFVISAVLLSAGLLGLQFGNISWRYQAIAVLSLLTYILSAWSLIEGLVGVQWLTVLVLPVFFTTGVGFFYFLVPARLATRIPIFILYGVGIYCLLLIENIFSVAAIRTIQLLRAAQAAGFLLTLTTFFFLYDTILSFRFNPWINFLCVSLVSFPLILQGLWCINLETKISRRIWLYTVGLALVQGETALVFSFWPLTVAVGSLALITCLYITLGLVQQKLNERLFQKTINEYVGVGIIVLLVIFLTTHWVG